MNQSLLEPTGDIMPTSKNTPVNTEPWYCNPNKRLIPTCILACILAALTAYGLITGWELKGVALTIYMVAFFVGMPTSLILPVILVIRYDGKWRQASSAIDYSMWTNEDIEKLAQGICSESADETVTVDATLKLQNGDTLNVAVPVIWLPHLSKAVVSYDRRNLFKGFEYRNMVIGQR